MSIIQRELNIMFRFNFKGNESEAIRLIENGADLNATWGMKQGILAIQVASEQGK